MRWFYDQRVSATRAPFEAAINNKEVQFVTVMEMNSREAIREAVMREFGFAVMSKPAFHLHAKLIAIRFFWYWDIYESFCYLFS